MQIDAIQILSLHANFCYGSISAMGSLCLVHCTFCDRIISGFARARVHTMSTRYWEKVLNIWNIWDTYHTVTWREKIVILLSKLENWGGGADFHILVFIDHENNRFQKKFIVQNMNIWISALPQLSSLLWPCEIQSRVWAQTWAIIFYCFQYRTLRGQFVKAGLMLII